MPAVYYIPSGPANLQAVFGAIDFNQIEEYYLEILGGGTIGTTPHFMVVGCEEDITLCFVNYLGGIDSISLAVTIEADAKSSSYQRPTGYPLVKSEHAITRSNIHANRTYTGAVTLDEAQGDWLEEVYHSPAAWMQQNGDYIPAVISDQKGKIKKLEQRFAYDHTVEWTLSHERIVIQN